MIENISVFFFTWLKKCTNGLIYSKILYVKYKINHMNNFKYNKEFS